MRVPQRKFECDREDIIQCLYDKLHPSDTSEKLSVFNVVVGPLGCGKSWCVAKAINRDIEVSVLRDVEVCCESSKRCSVPSAVNYV